MKVPQTAMYTLSDDFTWTKLNFNLPEAMVAHCSVQIEASPPKVAFIGGIPDITALWTGKLDQIHIFDPTDTSNEWKTGPTLVKDHFFIILTNTFF